MLELREQRDLAYLFITHDLSLAWVVADRIAVVYLGRIVELGSAADVIADPLHPYTKALVSVIPVPEAGAMADQILLSGETPSPTSIPPGCRFAPRCWLRRERGEPSECVTTDPELHPAEGAAPPEPDATAASAHVAACHFA
jgi:oligopeptide/dipeptide ABC transporter ATP-binding protein